MNGRRCRWTPVGLTGLLRRGSKLPNAPPFDSGQRPSLMAGHSSPRRMDPERAKASRRVPQAPTGPVMLVALVVSESNQASESESKGPSRLRFGSEALALGKPFLGDSQGLPHHPIPPTSSSVKPSSSPDPSTPPHLPQSTPPSSPSSIPLSAAPGLRPQLHYQTARYKRFATA